MTTRIQINTANIDEQIKHVCIPSEKSGLVQRRHATSANDLTHIDTAINQRPNGNRAFGCELTQLAAIDRFQRRTGLEQHQRATPIVIETIRQRNAKSGLAIHINGGKIRLASEQQCKHVVEATRSSMTRRPAFIVSFVHSRIVSQENFDNLGPTMPQSEDESRWLEGTRQTRVGIN